AEKSCGLGAFQRHRVLATSDRKPPLSKLARDIPMWSVEFGLRRIDFLPEFSPLAPAGHLGVNHVSAAQAAVTLNTLHIGPLV
ncbi:MAG TPA: hypothetical protein VFH41_03700, partial [Bradyrhizobium sp.]|nr:hypothetical protein [Bradyrhizobium sp.]